MTLAKTLLLITLSAATSALTCAPAVAQDDTSGPVLGGEATELRAARSIGVVVGADRAFHDGGFRVLPIPSGRVFEGGTGWGYTVGLSLDLGMDERSSIVARMAYESRPGYFRTTYSHVPNFSPVYQGGVQVDEATVVGTADVTYTLLSIEALYQFRVLKVGRSLRFGAAAGPALGYVLSGAIRQVETLVDPADANFVGTDMPTIDNGHSIVLFDGTMPEHSAMRFSLKGGVLAEVALPGDTWFVSPGVYYDYGLTKVTSSENWNLSVLSFQLDLRHAF
jgi:hypothetical protein